MMKKYKKQPNKSTQETLDLIFKEAPIQIKPQQKGVKVSKIDIDEIDTTTEAGSMKNGNDEDQNQSDIEENELQKGNVDLPGSNANLETEQDILNE